MLKKDNSIQKKNFPFEFPVEMETRAQGHVVARCPLLPGCQAQGKTAKEALDNLKNVIELYFSTASPAFFETLEPFNYIPTFYDLAEFKGHFYAATSRDMVLKSSNGAPGSWKDVPVTDANSKFFTSNPSPKDGAGDYATQIYCLCPYGVPGKETVLFAGTNLNGAVYYTTDGDTWKEAFSTGEDRIHALCEFKNRLYAGTSSQGKIFAFDGMQWNTVGSLSEVAVTCLGVFEGRLYAGTYPNGFIFSTNDGLNWEEMTGTGQNFIQCFKEFNGYLYAGTSSSKGVKVYRTANGRDWQTVYESARELNLYCMEVFENTLYAGTGNSGRVLKTQDGLEWKTAYAGDAEGVRAFGVFNDYLYACTENTGTLIRSTFDMARCPEISELKVEKLSSRGAVVTWLTDISATSEVHYGEKKASTEFQKVIINKSMELRHRTHLTDLKAETEYELKVVSAYRSSSLAVTQTLSFKTPGVLPPVLTSSTHPKEGKWEKENNVEMLLNSSVPLTGTYYILDHSPDTIPATPEASYTEDKRVALQSLNQGEWFFHAVGVDEAGNIGTEASHYRLNIDTEALPPVKVFSSTHPDSDKWVANPTPVIAWEAPSDLSGVTGFFIKADREPATSPGPSNGDFTQENRMTLGPLEDGLWYVHIATQDAAGNVGTVAAHYAIRVDTKAQAPSLSSPSHPQDGQWYSNNKVEVVMTPPHDLSGVEGYYYLINQEPQTLPTADARWTKKSNLVFDDVKDGVWYVHVRTKDRAENLSPQAAHLKVCVDTLASPPLVVSPSHADNQHWYRNRRVELNWDEPFEHSGIEGYYYNIDRKADTVPNDKTSLFTNQRTVSFELTDDGLWYFHVTTKDKAGNLDWKAAHYPLRVDTEVGKPFITSPTHPKENDWSSQTKAVFKLTPPDDLSGVTGYYYSFSEDAKVVPTVQGSTFTDQREIELEIPRDGVHILSVICQDAAGNVTKDPAVYRVRLDTAAEAPAVVSPSHPDAQKWYGTRRVELTWKEPMDLSGVDGYYFVFNHDENWMPDLKAMTWTTARGASFTLPEDGVWFAHVCAKDKAGNIGSVAHLQIRVDSQAQAPVVKSSTHPLNQWVKSSTPKFTWEAPAELSGVDGYYVALDSQAHTIPGPSNGKWTAENAITSPTLKDGKWFFHVTTKDKVGNVSKEAAHYAVLIDTAPPKSQMKSLPALIDKTQLNLAWDATDASGEVVSYDVQVKTGAGSWAEWLVNVTEKTAVFQGQDGQRYAFRCRAKDAAGNQEPYPDNEMAASTIDISAPPPVTQLKATPLAQGDIELKWTPVEDKVSGTDYYRVYRWLEGEKKQKISTDGQVKEVTFVDKGSALKENTVYYYCVQAVDRMGNEQHEGNQTAASLSDSGVGVPVVTCPTHSNDDWSANASPILTWSAPADATGIAGYYYALDLSPNTKLTPETSTFTDGRRLELSNVQSGIWYFHLIAKDKAGNLSDQTAHYRLKIDVQKPEAPHVASPSHPDSERWYSAPKAAFKLDSAPKMSGVDSFYYVFDQKPDTLPQVDGAQRTTEDSVVIKASDPGIWYFHAVVKDKAGNLSDPTHFVVLIAGSEMPPPSLSSPTHPKEGEATNNQEPAFTWEDRHDGSFKPVGYVYKLSQNEKEILTVEDQYTTEHSALLKNIDEGIWYFHVAAVGKKGKPGTLSSTRKVVIERLGKVHGTFFRKDGLTPVSGTKIEMVKGEKIAATAITDSKGKFNFSSLPEGKYEIRLHSDQFPVLRIKDIPITVDQGLENAQFVEDLGMLPTPPVPGPIRFYYFLKEDCNVTVEIFDSTGGLIDKLEEKKEGGAYNVSIWDAFKMIPGEYLYKLSAKSVLKNNMSRFSVKKFRLEKPSRELTPQPVS